MVIDEESFEAALVPSQSAAATPSGELQVLQDLFFCSGVTKQDTWVKFFFLA